MIRVDLIEVKEFENKLKDMRLKSFPFATKGAINGYAFATQKIARQTISENMIERNKFTKQSIRVIHTRTLKMSAQESEVGSIATYMADQEFGATKGKGRNKHGVRLTTSYAAGQDGAKPRTKLARGSNDIRKISLNKGKIKAKTRRQKNLVAVRNAAKTNQRYVFIDTGRKKAIYRVIGGKKNPRVKMVHDLTRQSVEIKKNPWLFPSVRKVQPMMESIYKRELQRQIDRLTK